MPNGTIKVEQILGLKAKTVRTPPGLVKLGGKGLSKGASPLLAKHLSIGLQEMSLLLSVNLMTLYNLKG
ncbi:MAG: hypothetical protein HY879_17425 [Deltaproteobacteria bacterium]|nr:hypothetical protein [Deltaproteobacteria bacterium]